MSPTVSGLPGLLNAKDFSVSAHGKPSRSTAVPSNVGEIFMAGKDAASRLQQGGSAQVIMVNQAQNGKAVKHMGGYPKLRGL